jgi:hypothetical protein
MNYLEKIKAEPRRSTYAKEDLLKPDYLIGASGNLEVYYAPFDYINKNATVVIVGITPGWTQMERAFATAITALYDGESYDEASRRAKSGASFAGSMRTNLVKMLDELGLHHKLNIGSTTELFDLDNDLLHATSALRYPVFVANKNYTGSTPRALKSSILWEQIEMQLVPELNKFKDALVIPLGKNVNDILFELKSTGKISNDTILSGFPHPSGANGHRAKQFEINKIQMTNKIKKWKN